MFFLCICLFKGKKENLPKLWSRNLFFELLKLHCQIVQSFSRLKAIHNNLKD